jgi:ribonuclease D
MPVLKSGNFDTVFWFFEEEYRQNDVVFAIFDAMSIPVMIQTQEEFEKVVKHLSGLEAFAIDTEFDHNHYAYGFTLCLIQIAAPDTCYLIDPFSIPDLTSLWRVLEDERSEKIFHDCGEDLRLLHLHGCSPRNIFDTSVAAKMLSFEKIGLSSVLNELLGVESSKKKQQSNWLKRPLLPLQLEYAANDVIHLLALRKLFAERLQAQDRWEWFEQMMRVVEQKDYSPKPKETFLSPKEQRDLTPFQQYILNELYRFRDEQAKYINKPHYQVFPEQLVYQVMQTPMVLKDWMNIKGIHYRIQNESVAERFRAVLEQAETTAKERSLSTQKQSPTSQEVAEWQRKAARYNRLREHVFLPIKRCIEENYGSHFAPYILSNETISSLISGDIKLSEVAPAFQQHIIRDAAQALNIDISAFE